MSNTAEARQHHRVEGSPAPVRTLGLNALSMLVDKMYYRLKSLENRIGLYEKRLSYSSRPDDVFIVSYPRSGATWVRRMVQQLTVGTAVEIESLGVKNTRQEADFVRSKRGAGQQPSRRVFKTHLPYRRVLKGGGKYLYVVRNGVDVVAADYRHCKLCLGFRGSSEEFFSEFLAGDPDYGSWFDHVRGWAANQDGLDVLYLKYEDLHADPEGAIRKIAHFCKIELREAALPKIVERSSPEYLKKHEEMLNPLLLAASPAKTAASQLIREGKTDSWKQGLNDAQKQVFAAELRRRLGGSGFDDYLPSGSA